MTHDLFAGHAESYAQFRPTYPDGLYDYLVDLASPCGVALDCATGNGQVAVDLAARVDEVVAVDVSEEQLSHAKRHPRVEYRHAEAEETGMAPDSVDLATVAAGLHWFEFDPFYDHIRTIVRDGGVIAAWTYRTMQVDETIDDLVRHLGDDILESDWHPRSEHVQNGYATIPFPFEEFDAPKFESKMEWTFEQLTGFISTWSGVQQHREKTGEDPVERIREELQSAWGDPSSVRTVTLPLHMRVGVIGA